MLAFLLTVLVASLSGSLHCAGMCGPFATLVTLGPPQAQQSPGFASVAVYNLARAMTYAVVGGLAGGLWALVGLGGSLLGAQRLGTTAAGILMLVVGVTSLLRTLGVRIPRLPGSGLALALARSVGARSQRGSALRRAWMLGTSTVLMPCGWLYAFALVAAGTQSVLWGSATMLVFWLGTLPALLMVSAGARLVGRRLSHLSRWVMPIALIVLGVFTLYARAGVVANQNPIDPFVTSDAPCCSHP